MAGPIIGTIGQLVNCGVGSVGVLLLMSGNQITSAGADGDGRHDDRDKHCAGSSVGYRGCFDCGRDYQRGNQHLESAGGPKALGLTPFSRSYLRLLGNSGHNVGMVHSG